MLKLQEQYLHLIWLDEKSDAQLEKFGDFVSQAFVAYCTDLTKQVTLQSSVTRSKKI